MPVFDDINVTNHDLIRKVLGIAAFVAPMATAVPTALTDGDGALLELPDGWRPLGRPSEDGVTWARETELSEIFGHGSPEPVRSDIRRATKRMTITALESRIVNLEQYMGMDLSAVETSTGGESVFDEAALPTYPPVRLLAIGMDVTGGGEYYIGKCFPNAKVTETGEQQWSDADQALVYPLTYTARQDPVLGTAVRHWLAGSGRAPEDEGFPAAASSSS